MASVFSRLIRQSGVYTVGNALIKLGGLLLMPLYLNTALLSQVGFGNLGVLDATAVLAIPLVGSGLTSAMLALIADPDIRAHHDVVPFTALVASVAAAVVSFGFFWVAASPLAGILLEGAEQASLFRLLGGYIAFKILGLVPLTWFRGRERAGWYMAASLAEMTILIASAYYFLAVRRLGLEGVLWAYVISSGINAIVLTAGMGLRIRWHVNTDVLKRLVRYGAPLTLVGVALPFLHSGDRYLLQWLEGPRAVAVYSLAYRLSGVFNTFVVQSLNLAFMVVGLKALGESREGIAVHRRTFRHFSIWGSWVVLGVSLFSYDVTAWLATDESYLQAIPQVLPLCLGYLFYGLYTITANVLYAAGKTRTISTGVISAAAFNIVLNLILIPWLGGMGAAFATLAAFGVLMYATSRLAQREYQVHFAWKVLLSAILLVLVLWVAAYPSQAWSLWPRLLWRAFLAALYPVFVLVLGLYKRFEIEQGRAWLRERNALLRRVL